MPARFFVDAVSSGQINLAEEEVYHVHVRRLRVGDAVDVLDGCGNIGHGTIIKLSKHQCMIDVYSCLSLEKPIPNITLLTAVPKGKRWQMLIEKATELGAGKIQPIIYNDSVAKAEGDIGKWIKWTKEACKQCGRAWLPELFTPISFEEWYSAAYSGISFAAHPSGEWMTLHPICDEIRSCKEITFIIGPEAGFTNMEEQMLHEKKCLFVALSDTILRTETACWTALAQIKLIYRT